jgi:CubicO group peptidase (beta-lactamase class C family)
MTARNLRHAGVIVAAFLWTGLAVAAGAAALPRAAPDAVGMSPQRLERLTSGLQTYVDEGRVAGSVALVARRGKVVYLRAFGQRDRESGSPMRTDSIFRIASQSKAITAIAAMMLVEEGKLSLTDPLQRFFPEFANGKVAVPRENGQGYDLVAARRPITIRDLLLHTSGLGYGTGPAADAWQKAGIQGWYFADRDEPIGALVARMGSLPLDAQPGERWVYGYSLDVLGAVIEKVSGLPFDAYLQQRVFAPLGLRDTSFNVPEQKRDRFVTVYAAGADGKLTRAPDGGGWQGGQGSYVGGPRKAFSGGAGLTSTAEDYARVLQMMLGGGRLGDARLLSRTTVELMTSDHLGEIFFRPGSGEGLGFSVVKDAGLRGSHGSVGEYGWGGAYHTTYWVDPKEELVVVYLTQVLPAGNLDDFEKLRALVYQAIVD